MACTNTGPFDGGTYNNPVIVNPEVTGGEIANSELTNVSISGAITLDDAATQSIQDALCETIADCVGSVSGDTPASSVAEEGANVLPTTIVGEDRSQLLGKPVVYLEVAGYLIPAYKKG